MATKEIDIISVPQAAERLNLSRQRVLQMINSKWLPAKKVGRNYVIDAPDLSLVAERPKSGPKPKKKE